MKSRMWRAKTCRVSETKKDGGKKPLLRISRDYIFLGGWGGMSA
jgi:hypothetical protein